MSRHARSVPCLWRLEEKSRIIAFLFLLIGGFCGALCGSPMDDLKKFAGYFLPYKVSLITGILCILAGVIFNLTIPLIVGQAVDANWTQVNWSRLTVSALKVFGASVVSGVF